MAEEYAGHETPTRREQIAAALQDRARGGDVASNVMTRAAERLRAKQHQGTTETKENS